MKKLIKGMHKDSERVDQPESTYRDALNANLYYSKGALVSEEGTSLIGTHPIQVIGAIPLLNNQVISFGWVDDSGADVPIFDYTQSAIVLTDTVKNSSRILYKNSELNFQKDSPIVGEFKVDATNEIIIYFTDNHYLTEDTPEGPSLAEYNSPRAFNVTRQLEHITSSVLQNPYYALYNHEDAFTVSKLDLFAKVGKHSLIEKAAIYEGGVLVSGAYHLALCYSDENFLETDYFVVSNPVYIYQGQEQQYPADVISGCPEGSQTNKAIKFSVRTFQNTNYKFLQPAVIKRVGNAEFAYKLERIELSNNLKHVVEIAFTGNEDSASTSVEDIILDNVNYVTAKTLTQLDNRLYLANLQSRKDIGFQRYAHNIIIQAKTKSFDKFDVRVFDVQSLNKGYALMSLPLYNRSHIQGSEFGIGQTFIREDTAAFTDENKVRRSYFEYIQKLLDYEVSASIGDEEGGTEVGYTLTDKIAKGYKDYRFSFKHKTFRRGEVYAFYISFVLHDGTETYAYHIPGRDKLYAESRTGDFIPEDVNFGATDASWGAIQNLFGFYPSEIAENNSDAQVYQYVDTSALSLFTPSGTSFIAGNTNDMSYWNNQNERYPITHDFTGGIVTGSGVGTTNSLYDLRNSFVKHHKMPSNHNENFAFLKMDVGNAWYSSHQSILNDDSLNNSDLLNDTITGFENEYANHKLITRDPIRLLGIKLRNIKIPRHILKKVQGYKVYYAKRKDEDKLIVGQSIAVPSHPRYASVPTQNKMIARLGPFKNAFYLYGGLHQDDSNAMEINAPWKQAYSDADKPNGRYIGHPVFTFHDFNMLRKRPTLEGLTHMSLQAAVVFRSYQGGPNLFRKPASHAELTDGTGDSQSGLHGATELSRFTALGWIHPDLGNTTDFGLSGEIFDITDNFVDLTEDVENPFGYGDGGSAPSGNSRRQRGKNKNIEQDADKLRAQDLMIKNWRTSVYIAAKYIKPGQVFRHLDVVKGGSNRQYFNFWSEATPIPNTQLLFRLDPKSKIYARGQTNIEIPESTSFKGASVLYNRGGESSIVLGLDSGLPHLKGFRKFTANYWGAGPGNCPDGISGCTSGTSWDLVKWGDDNKYLFPDAFYYRGTRLPDHFEDFYSDFTTAQKEFRGYRYSLMGNKTYDGHPMAWLVNVESAKTDVYSPFDKQELVWTGYYKAITLTDEGLRTGDCEDDYGNASNYYNGGQSGEVYGGDTYITRYSFRSTSQSYGHCFFRAATNLGDAGVGDGEDDTDDMHVHSGNKDRFQADIPDFYNAFDSDTWGKGTKMTIWQDWLTISDEILTHDEKVAKSASLINSVSNWQQGNSDPVSTLFSFMVESDDNIGLRHKNDIEKGITTKYFDADVASDVLFAPPTQDLTKQDNLLYSDHYSVLQDIRVAVPYPKRKPSDENITVFPTRVIRSKVSGISIGDKYRQFLANDFKDLPKNRGDIWSLFSLTGILYIHTEGSLFQTRGKEELSVGGIAAFIGSGNIFDQEPVELRDTQTGYGGTTSIFGGVSTPFGRFWVSRRDRKMYMAAGGDGGIEEVMSGMESWFRENMPFKIEDYGVDVDGDDFNYNPDSTVAAAPMGYTVTYDPVYKRILVTKREPVPNAEFITQWEAGNIVVRNNVLTLDAGCTDFEDDADHEAAKSDTRGTALQNTSALYCGPIGLANPQFFSAGGWTLSYYPELKIWGSRHSYLPKLYVSTAKTMFSFKDSYMWGHNNLNAPGSFYNTTYPFEIEFIDNTQPGAAKSYASFAYWADIVKKDVSHITEYENRTYAGFTSFYVYNTTQISALSTNIHYLHNARKVNKFWYINSFRDLTKYTDQTSSYINSGFANVVDNFTTVINAPISSEPMFTEEGVVNANYIDSTKSWYMQKKFVDHFLGVRLSSDNSSGDLLYLYAAGTKFRNSIR